MSQFGLVGGVLNIVLNTLGLPSYSVLNTLGWGLLVAEALRARRHLQVETAEGVLLTVGEVARFVERCREVGVPDDAVLTSPGADLLRRFPISFAVTWTEDL